MALSATSHDRRDAFSCSDATASGVIDKHLRTPIGALLLDLEDPGRVIAHLPEPLMVPQENEREGYVPNVLYSCGSMVHRDHLILPYGFSDAGIGIALVRLPDLLDALLEHRCDR